MDWANTNGVPLYMVNPHGSLKIYEPKGIGNYKPLDEVGRIVRNDMP